MRAYVSSPSHRFVRQFVISLVTFSKVDKAKRHEYKLKIIKAHDARFLMYLTANRDV